MPVWNERMTVLPRAILGLTPYEALVVCSAAADFKIAEAALGLGRVVASHHRASTPHQAH
jgi:hypothetical protein